jgi:hypothetical protein
MMLCVQLADRTSQKRFFYVDISCIDGAYCLWGASDMQYKSYLIILRTVFNLAIGASASCMQEASEAR